MSMKNPPHPGKSLQADLDAIGLNIPDGAKRLGLSHSTLQRLVDGETPITPAIAIRLEEAGWGVASFFVRLQAEYDLAQERLRIEASKGE